MGRSCEQLYTTLDNAVDCLGETYMNINYYEQQELYPWILDTDLYILGFVDTNFGADVVNSVRGTS